jgi:acyl-CoA synthetase (AMP-forming)/AMP-acid ligase II
MGRETVWRLRNSEQPRQIPGGWRCVATILDRSLRETPDAEALVSRHARFTYRELDAAVASAACGLQALGVRTGDRVAACAGNHTDIVIAFLAVQRLGCVWVGINRPLAPPEKEYQLRDAGVSVLLADRATLVQLRDLSGHLSMLRHIIDMEPGDSESAWAKLLREHSGVVWTPQPVDPHAPAAIAYTSGTTGRPKGAVHSQHNMMVVAASHHAGLRGPHWDPRLRHGVTLPLTILNLQVLEVVTPLSGGGACICMDRSDAIGIAEWVEKERIETFTVTPTTMFDLLTKPEIDKNKFTSVKFVLCGGSAVSEKLRSLYLETFGKRLLGGFALTEAPTSVTGVWLDKAPPIGSCGRAFAHVELAILDANGDRLQEGEVGEICIRAATTGEWAGVYTPMLGYWERASESAAALRGGWLHTGDLGCLNAESDLFVKDRLKELIIRGGSNIYPAEVERVVNGDPRVKDVAVIGKVDERLGETVVAFVELAPGVEASEQIIRDLTALCLQQLAKYKVPEAWHFLTAMPRNSMNKVVKPKLRELLTRD